MLVSFDYKLPTVLEFLASCPWKNIMEEAVYLIFHYITEYCIQLWGPQCKKDMDLLKWVQRRAMRTGAPLLWRKSERVGAVQPGVEKAPGKPYCSLSIYRRGPYKKDEDRVFTKACGDRTRGNGFKLQEGRFRFDIRQKLFTMRAVRDWKRLPREVVGAPSLESVQGQAGWGFEQPGLVEGVPAHGRGLD